MNLSPEVVAKLERLAAAGIRIAPGLELPAHFVLERNGYAALVERTGEGFGGIGSSGLLTEEGFTALVWRGETAWFVRKSFSRPASPDEVAALRAFSTALREALSGNSG